MNVLIHWTFWDSFFSATMIKSIVKYDINFSQYGLTSRGFILLNNNPLKHGGGARCTPLPPFFFAIYSNYHETTHTWKFLTLQTKKSTNLVPLPLRALWNIRPKPPMHERVKWSNALSTALPGNFPSSLIIKSIIWEIFYSSSIYLDYD